MIGEIKVLETASIEETTSTLLSYIKSSRWFLGKWLFVEIVDCKGFDILKVEMGMGQRL